jgi:hypothetical protein
MPSGAMICSTCLGMFRSHGSSLNPEPISCPHRSRTDVSRLPDWPNIPDFRDVRMIPELVACHGESSFELISNASQTFVWHFLNRILPGDLRLSLIGSSALGLSDSDSDLDFAICRHSQRTDRNTAEFILQQVHRRCVSVYETVKRSHEGSREILSAQGEKIAELHLTRPTLISARVPIIKWEVLTIVDSDHVPDEIESTSLSKEIQIQVSFSPLTELDIYNKTWSGIAEDATFRAAYHTVRSILGSEKLLGAGYHGINSACIRVLIAWRLMSRCKKIDGFTPKQIREDRKISGVINRKELSNTLSSVAVDIMSQSVVTNAPDFLTNTSCISYEYLPDRDALARASDRIDREAIRIRASDTEIISMEQRIDHERDVSESSSEEQSSPRPGITMDIMTFDNRALHNPAHELRPAPDTSQTRGENQAQDTAKSPHFSWADVTEDEIWGTPTEEAPEDKRDQEKEPQVIPQDQLSALSLNDLPFDIMTTLLEMESYKSEDLRKELCIKLGYKVLEKGGQLFAVIPAELVCSILPVSSPLLTESISRFELICTIDENQQIRKQLIYDAPLKDLMAGMYGDIEA